MRKRNGPLWVVLVLVGVAIGGAQAQSTSTPVSILGTQLSAFVDRFPEERYRVLDWLFGILSNPDGGPSRVGETCGFIAGAGSKPRLDGGGGTLQVYETWPFHGGVGADYPARLSPLSDVVIIDEFELPRVIDEIERALTIRNLSGSDPRTWREAVGLATLQAFATWEPTPEGAPGYAVPHGHLVLHHVLVLLGGDDVTVVSTAVQPATADQRGRGTIVLDVAGQTFRIHLEPIDLADVSTIRAAMHRFAEEPYRDAVAITSWGLVDCELSERYLAVAGQEPNLGWSIDRYLMSLFAESEEAEVIAREVCDAFLDSGLVDPTIECGDGFLLAYTLRLMAHRAAEEIGWPFLADGDPPSTLPYGRVFASAGNQRLPFPMPPAAWPGVMGVAACSNGPERARFSNVGDFIDREHLIAPGAWFPVAIDGHPVGYWGTSFAAPHAALNPARYDRSPDEPYGFDRCGHPDRYPTAP